MGEKETKIPEEQRRGRHRRKEIESQKARGANRRPREEGFGCEDLKIAH